MATWTVRLEWIDNKGRRRGYTLRPGHSYYLGRPSQEDLERLQGLPEEDRHITGIYIIPEDSAEPPIYTGIEEPLLAPHVSRRHARITLQVHDGSVTLVIQDYGSKGTGSVNGTRVNNEQLSRGAATHIPLEPGESVELQLGSHGPRFTLRPEKRTETPKTPRQARRQEVQAILSALEQPPAQPPLIFQGLQGYPFIAPGVHVYGEEKAKLRRELYRLLSHLENLLEALEKSDWEKIEEAWAVIRSEMIQKTIQELQDATLSQEYGLLIKYLRDGAASPLRKSAKRLKELIKDHLDRLL